MPTRTARTAWNGGLQDGSGQVELSSSGVGTFEVSFPKRAADDADGTTSPEELIAAAHSSCFAMQLSNVVGPGRRHATVARRHRRRVPREGPGGRVHAHGDQAHVEGEVDGIDEAAFQKAAEQAKAGCPREQGPDRRGDHPGGQPGRLNRGDTVARCRRPRR